ncbi:Uncharacterized protein Rs2_06738 [Raphanus sativus]|nr:Uncharacterized protein Rs2_06738 [Raphanus sativus]
MAKLFGCPINVEAEEEEEDGGGISIAVDISRSVNQPDGEATSSSAGLPQSDQREETYPCFGAVRKLESEAKHFVRFRYLWGSRHGGGDRIRARNRVRIRVRVR